MPFCQSASKPTPKLRSITTASTDYVALQSKIEKLKKLLRYKTEKNNELEQCYSEKGALIIKLEEEEILDLKSSNSTMKSVYKPEDTTKLIQLARDTLTVLLGRMDLE